MTSVDTLFPSKVKFTGPRGWDSSLSWVAEREGDTVQLSVTHPRASWEQSFRPESPWLVRRETPGHTGSQVPSRCHHLDAPASGDTHRSPKASVSVMSLKPQRTEVSWAESPSRWLGAGIALDWPKPQDGAGSLPFTCSPPHPTPGLAGDLGEFLRASGLLDPHPRCGER